MSRFKNNSSDDSSDATVDITSMIDCVFILLIFFIVTTTFVEETGVEVDKPQAASSVQLEKSSILLAITANGAVVYGGQDVGIGGVRSLVKRMTSREDIPVIIQADRTINADLLVKVVDEAKLGGAVKVSIATKKSK